MVKVDQNSDFGCLKPECGSCFALCCLALCFTATQGFPADKAAGKPCPHLMTDFRCRIHADLWRQGCRGCVSYDCLGAGQWVSQITYRGRDWRQNPDLAEEMGQAYLVMQQLHEMLWYLRQARDLPAAESIHDQLAALRDSIQGMAHLQPDLLLHLDLVGQRQMVSRLLRQTSDLVRGGARDGSPSRRKLKPKLRPGADLIGMDLRQERLWRANLHGACLIAADLRGVVLQDTDLLGADLRDANLRGADLSRSLFLTQAQLNAARGDQTTKLPGFLQYPESWQRLADK